MYVIAGATGKNGRRRRRSASAGRQARAGHRPRRHRAQPWRDRGAPRWPSPRWTIPTPSPGRSKARREPIFLYPASLTSADPIGDGWRTADAIARAVDRSELPHLVFLSSVGRLATPRRTGIVRSLHAAEVRLRPPCEARASSAPPTFWTSGSRAAGATAAGQLPTFIRPDRVVPHGGQPGHRRARRPLLLEGPPLVGAASPLARAPRFQPPRSRRQLTRLLGRAVTPAFAPDEAVFPTLTSFGASPAFAEQIRLLYLWINQTDDFDTENEGPLVRGPTEPMEVFRPALPAASGSREQRDQAMGPLAVAPASPRDRRTGRGAPQRGPGRGRPR